MGRGTLRPPYQHFFFPTYRCLFKTQTQRDQNPHTKWALFSTLSSTFLRVGGDRNKINYRPSRSISILKVFGRNQGLENKCLPRAVEIPRSLVNAMARASLAQAHRRRMPSSWQGMYLRPGSTRKAVNFG